MRGAGDSIGARVTVVASGVPPGLGEPVFDRLDADVAHALMSINAVKAVEIGAGTRAAAQRGSEHRDELTPGGFRSNHAGGILGGISSGQDVIAHLTLKPTSSIQVPGDTIDTHGNAVADRDHRAARSVRGPAGHADRGGDARDRAHGPLPAPPRAERGRKIGHAGHHGTARLIAASPARLTVDRQFKVAVVGATGLVGETMVTVLEERDFPVAQLHALASERSVGRRVSFRGRNYPVQELQGFDFAQLRLRAVFRRRRRCHASTCRARVAAGCLVIDNTSEFRYREDVPLVVPEVNPQALEAIGTRGIIANPNCSTIQLVVALKPLLRRGRDRAHRRGDLPVRVRRRARSGGGAGAPVDRGARAARARSNRRAVPSRSPSTACPHIDVFQDNGYTREEMKIVWETRKILGDAELARECHRGARAGVLRAFRGGAHRDPAPPERRRRRANC